MPQATEAKPKETAPEEQLADEPKQSVYIADRDLVKTYPISMSNNEIDYSLHTEVRGKTPEDYFVNFLPLKSIQDGFKEIVEGGMRAGEPIGKAAAKYQDETITPAFKYAITGDLEKVYKPWIDIWKESAIGKTATDAYQPILAKQEPQADINITSISDLGMDAGFKAVANAPAFIPWFLAEHVPGELLEFGTKPLNWIGAYGVEKFGPAIINKVISKLPESVRATLLKDIFAAEKASTADYEILGLKPNVKTSEVSNAYKQAAKYTHPDAGGSAEEFNIVNNAYKNIMKSRSGWMEELFDYFRGSKVAPKKTQGSLLTNESGSVLIPSEGDLVKIGSEMGQIVKISGNVAAVNLAGKMIRANTKDIEVIPNESQEQKKFRDLIDKKDIESEQGLKEAEFIYQDMDKFDAAYNKQLKKEYKTDNPNIISADAARVADMKGRGELEPKTAAERHAGSSAYAKLKYEKMLVDPMLINKNIALMAGVSGAGKTGAVRKLAPKDLENDIVYDTNVASFESGKRIIEKALESDPDREVRIFYVDRDPIKAFEEGVLPRYSKQKRVVSIPTHLNNMKSNKAIQELYKYYQDNPRVKFRFIGNYGKPGEYSKIDIETLSSKVYNLGEAKETLEKSIQEKLKSGLLTKEAAKAFLGGKKADVRKEPQSNDGDSDRSAVNPENLAVSQEAKSNLVQATNTIKEEIENQTGQTMTHEEVIEKAKEAEIISKGVSREATLEFQASLLKTRQHLAALAEQDTLTPEFLDTLKVMANLGTDIARNLESFKIEAMPEYATIKVKIIKDLQKLGVSSKDILDAAKDVNFQDEQSVAKFYRKFVKPTLPEILDEFVYMNILSSPLTHIVNTFSNFLQLSAINPLTKLSSGTADIVASSLTGAPRKHYISEVPDFYKGVLNAVPEAFAAVSDAMKGKKNIERPDVTHLPTLSKFVDYATLKIGKYVPRALEASDIFFRTLITSGEVESMSKALGHEPDQKELMAIKKEAQKRADHYVFRSKPDSDNATGQGDVLSAIDQMTNAIYRLRSVPGFKWFIRFVQTPMNILKQGIEYSPAGVATLKGSKDKSEQAGKAALGSLVFAGASWLAATNLTTWSAPTGQKDKNDFYAAGLQPYSIRIGDTWVSYTKIGPLAYPIAMAAALHYFIKESPKALSDSEMDKAVDAVAGIMKFFSDQSYMQGLADLTSFARGEKTKAFASVPTQLVPLSSLQGWVNNIMDPLQRKAAKGLSMESVIDQIQMKIVGMSRFVPPQIDSDEIPVKKQMQGVNAISPVRMSKVNQGKMADYKDTQRTKQEMNQIEKELS